MDTQLLKDKIAERGMVTKFIYQKLGLSHNGFYKKMNGVNKFTPGEIETLAELLNLSKKEVNQIFYNK